MIEQVLPRWVSAADAFTDRPPVLFPAERALISRAGPQRQREFATVRMCARAALGRLGIPAVPIVPDSSGMPGWPPGVTGSMTHCAGYRAAAVARAGDAAAIGIDAEPHAALPPGVLAMVASDAERSQIASLGPVSDAPRHWDRLLFSAKESVYKAWYPLMRRWLGFEDVHVGFDPDAGTFAARLLLEGPIVADRELTGFAGRFLIAGGLIVTAVVVPSAQG